ncbi:MAG: PAS domain S-box protein [Spirochaetes bacterium]|nr:PAS domain S-box protein [Spirochaetota bacterium]
MTDVFLKIIEEFADGFLILDGQRRVIFFNDVLQRTTGLRSQDIFAREDAFLGELGVLDGQCDSHAVDIADREGTVRRFTVTGLAFESDNGEYLLVRVKPVERPASPSSAAGWEQLFRNFGDPLFTADLSGRILCANPSFYRLVGYDPSEELPNLSQLYLNPAELDDKLIRLAESESLFNLETHFAARDRQLRRVLDSSWITRDDTGNVTGYTSHLKDVTYVKNLEARLKISERNYIVLFDTILSSIVIVDPLCRILNCNYSAEKLFGYRWQEIAGRDYDEVFRAHRKGTALADVLKQAAAGKGPHVETDVPRLCKDGTIRFTYASYTPLVSSDGETIAWSIMERDLTDRVRLEKKLQESFEQIKNTQRHAIFGFATLLEYREAETGTHLKRMEQFTRVIATGLAKLPKYADYITPDYIEDLCLSSVLHDVGKVGIEDAILMKPGKLTPEEFERVKQHAALGGDALRSMDKEITFQSFLTIGKEIASFHHERWDGTGYPTGRRGEQIPLSARIVALPDVYDALTSKRAYKEPIPHEEAMKIIASERGTHFDPDIVDVFLTEQETFQRIRMFESFREHPESIDDLITTGQRARTAS